MENGTPELQTPNDTTKQEQTIDWEKRYKDVQASYTKSQQENSVLKAERDVLMPLVSTATINTLSEEEQERLLDLRDTDPEAWRRELNSLETKAQNELSEKVTQATSTANTQFELSRRERLLDEFVSRPDTTLSLDNLDDIPVRITKKLENGELSFEDYLNEANTYLNTGKVVKPNSNTQDEPDFHSKGGDDQVAQPTSESLNKDYRKTVW